MNMRTAGSRPRREAKTAWQMPIGRRHCGSTTSSSLARTASAQIVSVSAIGASLGSGVASQLAAQRPVERLALITPFDSMVATARAHYPLFPVNWLLDERYESDRALSGYRRPVLILHGGRDDIVPEANTLRLVSTLPAPPTVVRVPEAGHNDIDAHPQFAPALAAFMR
jgi:pimeloyl-ACP methyl ester carboxylesterase